MKQYFPLAIITILTLIPIVLMAGTYLSGETVEWSKYIIPMLSPAATGIIYLLQTKIKNGLDIFKVEIKNDVSKVQDGFSELKSDTSELKDKIDTVQTDIIEIKVSQQLKKEFKHQLEIAATESISMLEEDQSLKHFATLKTKTYIDFVCDLRESIDNITRDIFDIKKNQGICISEEIRKEGYDILGKKLIDKYYDYHEKNVIEFLNKIEEIVFDDTAHKKVIFQEECIKFLRKFISELDKTYIKHQ